MTQTIIAYIIIGLAVAYMIYSVAKKFSRKKSGFDNDLKCGSSCDGCSVKNCYHLKNKNKKS